ncbi:MAG: ccmE [Rickettsiaceae bacterium]|nr:ccmE [Rickettsiaceae bacterium]
MCLGISASLILNNFKDNLVFFYSPTELLANNIEGKIIRVGGLVEKGSVSTQEGNVTVFSITDLQNSVRVSYKGILPPMFRQEQGMVAKGKLENGVLVADSLLTKHDEKYMPPEVADALKKSGQWREGE